MDNLLKCAKAYQKLLNVHYHFVLGRKGKIEDIILGFDKVDFHHLVGFQHLFKLKKI